MKKKSPLHCITSRVIAIFCMSICLLIGLSSSIYAQAKITGIVKGLAYSDTAIIRIQKSGEQYFFKKLGGIFNSADVSFSFDNLPNGKWSISIDAKGYLYPTAKVLTLNNNTIDNTITLTKAPADSNFIYQWQDDSSYVGHAQQAYINDKVEINILGVAERVPDDFNAINILNEYGFFLSDGLSTWTSEDAYRLYQTLKKLNFRKFSEKDSVVVRAKILITTQKIDRDIDFFNKDGVDFVTISRDAFTYATPQVVTVDGVKGKFFSKRLFTALVYYNSDKGTQTQFLDQLAKERYGFEFLNPSETLKQLMNETETNFQQFTSYEKILILTMFEEFPDAMQRQDQLKYMVRRINGQPHPVYSTAPAIAWTTNKTIEWMESGFISQAIEYVQRLILHEKSHFLWAYSLITSQNQIGLHSGDGFRILSQVRVGQPPIQPNLCLLMPI